MDDCEEISPLDAVLTQEPMIDIDESTYEQLSGRDLSPADKMILVRCCCKLDPSYGRLKEKIIQELFFQTVSFSVEGGLDLGGVSILLKLVERELQYLMVRDPETLLFAGGESPEQGKLRFRANVRTPLLSHPNAPHLVDFSLILPLSIPVGGGASFGEADARVYDEAGDWLLHALPAAELALPVRAAAEPRRDRGRRRCDDRNASNPSPPVLMKIVNVIGCRACY